MPRRQADGRWLVDIRPDGSHGRRIRKTFTSKPEAVRFEAHLRNQAINKKPWNPAGIDARKLSTMCRLWFDLHGRTLKDGQRRLRHLVALCEGLGDPPIGRFTAKDFSRYRAQRIQDVSENTANHDLAYLRAVFNELIRLGEYQDKNPLSGLRAFRIDQSELSYLDPDQVKALIDAARDPSTVNPHTHLVILVCLATGARWSEAETLRIHQVKNGQVQFFKTKSGKSRFIPIDQALEDLLRRHRDRYQEPDGRIFAGCYHAFGKAVERAGLVLPRGQLSHILRHTFASHFMMAGGNILALQRALGHSDIKMTMRYAHLAPDHLQEVKRLNLAGHFLDT